MKSEKILVIVIILMNLSLIVLAGKSKLQFENRQEVQIHTSQIIDDSFCQSINNRFNKWLSINSENGGEEQLKYNTPWLGLCYDIFVTNNLAYIISEDSFEIIDVQNPRKPTKIGGVDNVVFAQSVVNGTLAFTSTYDGSLEIIDVSDPTNLTVIRQYQVCMYFEKFFVEGSFVYLLGSNERPNGNWDQCLIVVDVSDPATPIKVYECVIEEGSVLSDFFVKNSLVYCLRDNQGLAIFNFSNPTAPKEIGIWSCNDPLQSVFVDEQYACIIKSSEDVMMIIDVSNPTNPEKVVDFSLEPRLKDLFVCENLVYLLHFRTLTILEIANLRLTKKAECYYDKEPGGFKRVFVTGNFAYLLKDYEKDHYSNRKFYIFDVSNPEKPRKMYPRFLKSYWTSLLIEVIIFYIKFILPPIGIILIVLGFILLIRHQRKKKEE